MEEKPVVVLDTNVFVGAGFSAHSASARLVAAVRDGRLRMAWSAATRGETERVLERIPPLSWPDVAALFRDEERVDDPADADGYEQVPDPADRKFAALADAAGAVLVSADQHLLAGRAAARHELLSPREAVERWGEILG